MHKTDILVIGAGPSGCVAAGICKKQGFDVTVVEKQKFILNMQFQQTLQMTYFLKYKKQNLSK